MAELRTEHRDGGSRCAAAAPTRTTRAAATVSHNLRLDSCRRRSQSSAGSGYRSSQGRTIHRHRHHGIRGITAARQVTRAPFFAGAVPGYPGTNHECRLRNVAVPLPTSCLYLPIICGLPPQARPARALRPASLRATDAACRGGWPRPTGASAPSAKHPLHLRHDLGKSRPPRALLVPALPDQVRERRIAGLQLRLRPHARGDFVRDVRACHERAGESEAARGTGGAAISKKVSASHPSPPPSKAAWS